MSIKLCTAEYMISDTVGLGMSRSFFPRIVSERFVASTKDGAIERSPDPVTMIDTDLTWYNASGDAQVIDVHVHRAPRSVTASNPNSVTIEDAWTYAVGLSPSASKPTVTQNGMGVRLRLDRSTAGKLAFGRIFTDVDDWVSTVRVGVVEPGEALHFRYLAALVTPGEWRVPDDPRHEAYARWVRLTAIAHPAHDGV